MTIQGTDTPSTVVDKDPAAVPAPEKIPGMESLDDVVARVAGKSAPEEAKTEEKEETSKEEPRAEVEEKDPPKKEEKKDPAGSRFAALARREKAAREAEAAAERRAKEIEAREAAIKERESRWDVSKKRPLQALKELGFTYQDVTQDVLGGYKEPEEDPVDKKIKPFAEKWDKLTPDVENLQKELKELKDAMAAKEQQTQYQAAIAEIRKELADVDRYELVNLMGNEGVDLVRDTIIEYYKQNQRLLDYAEACEVVEKYYETEFEKYASTKKFKSRLAAPTPTPSPKPQPSKSSTPSKEARESKQTLTNGLATAPRDTVDIDKLPKHEAIEYLAKKLQFK